MSSAEWYGVVKEHGLYNIHVVNSNLNKIYKKLWLAMLTKDVENFPQLMNSEHVTYTLVNQPIFICDINCCYTNCIAVNLCHFAVFHDCKEILKELLKHGGDLSKKTVEVTLFQGQRIFEDKDSLIDLIVRHFDEPVKYFQDLFDGFIETTDLGSTYEFKLDFTILYPSARMDKNDLESERQMCVLNEIVNSSYDVHSEECGLLQHPLIEAYLTCKWIHYRRFFYVLVAVHVLFVASLSTMAFLIVETFKNFSATQNTTVEFNYQNGTPEVVLSVMKTLNWLLFFLGFLLLGHALIQAYFIPFRKLYCQFEILSNLFTSVFVLPISAFGIVLPLHWLLFHTLPVIILTAWINLMLIIGRIPSLGCYSLMFTTVMKNFLKVMVSFTFLIVGFALSFSLMFPMSEFFNNPFRALLRTIVMMVGELDYAETFSKKGVNIFDEE